MEEHERVLRDDNPSVSIGNLRGQCLLSLRIILLLDKLLTKKVGLSGQRWNLGPKLCEDSLKPGALIKPIFTLPRTEDTLFEVAQ